MYWHHEHGQHKLPTTGMPTSVSTGLIENHELRPTFAVAVASVTLAVLQAESLMVFARESIDDSIYAYVYYSIRMNIRSRPISGASMTQPPTPVCLTPARLASAEPRFQVKNAFSVKPIPGSEVYSDATTSSIYYAIMRGSVQPALLFSSP